MRKRDTPVTDREREFRQIRRLLSDTHIAASADLPPAVNMWSANRFEAWMVYSAPAWFDRAGLNRRLHLWKAGDDTVVGLAIVEGSGREVHAITHPQARKIEPAIYSWVEEHWEPHGDAWVTYAEQGDTHREAVLTGLGYRAAGESEVMYAYDLNSAPAAVALPPGFAIRDATQHTDPVARSRLRWMVFRPEVDPESAPGPVMQEQWSYDPSLDLVVVAPDGELVAFATGWINAQTRISEVEPIGTHPTYLRRGLARAVVCTCFDRLRARGVRWTHIASAAEPAVSNRLYRSLGPVGEQHFVRWEKAGSSSLKPRSQARPWTKVLSQS
jgi:ribosomal protein S18 acetylase RimI-like enzyme